MEEKLNNNQEKSVKPKNKKAKVVIITLSIILVLTLGLQVYASTNGYGNVFFMIKNLITTGTLSGKDEIFSDKDITLSYKSIELAEGLKIQVNRLEIKDGKTSIYALIKSDGVERLPLTYKAITLFTDGAETAEKEIKGNEPQNTDYLFYEDVITLDYEVNEKSIITIKISDKNGEELRTLEINMETREITVKGEKEFEKISQIELRKYLNLFSALNNGISQNDNLLYMAEALIEVGGEYEGYGIIPDEVLNEALRNNSRRELINQIIKEIYGDNAKFEIVKNSQGKDVEVLKGEMAGWKYDKQHDVYTALTAGEDYHHGKCLKIEDISYDNEIYTVKYIYILATGNDEDSDNLENLEQYETTIKLKRIESNLYSKYQIVSLEKGTELKNKVSTNVEDNIEDINNEFNTNNVSNTTNTINNSTNSKNTINNSSTNITTNNTDDSNTTIHYSREEIMDSSNWIQFWPEIGMKFKLPKNFEQGQVVSDNNTFNVGLSGWIVTNKFNFEQQQYEGYEGVPVKIRFYNEIHNNTNLEDALEYNDERRVKSTDNRGWTDWFPLKDNNVPNSPINRIY